MTYKVAIPKEIKDQISTWGLSRAIQVYLRLHDLGDKHEKVCMRLAAPAPTFVCTFDLTDDEKLPMTTHWFTYWLTYGPQDGVLYVRQGDHQQED